jgi:hypothetical protein
VDGLADTLIEKNGDSQRVLSDTTHIPTPKGSSGTATSCDAYRAGDQGAGVRQPVFTADVFLEWAAQVLRGALRSRAAGAISPAARGSGGRQGNAVGGVEDLHRRYGGSIGRKLLPSTAI